MRTPAVLAAAALSVLVPSAARAQPVSAPSGPDTYLQLQAGPFIPQGDIDKFDTGFDFGLLFGARFDQRLSVEGGVAYYRTKLDTYAPGVGVGGPSKIQSTLGVVPLTASVRVRQAFKRAEVSAFGGIGIHFAHLSSDLTSGTVPATTTSSSSSSSAFGFHVGAQAAVNLWPTMLVGVEATRTFVNARFESVATRIDGLRVDVTLTYRL